MADFCLKCSFKMFGEDTKDLAGLSSEADTKAGFFAVVLCESCGPIQVNHHGQCISPDCEECAEDYDK
jgi:hypothetical protein